VEKSSTIFSGPFSPSIPIRDSQPPFNAANSFLARIGSAISYQVMQHSGIALQHSTVEMRAPKPQYRYARRPHEHW